MSQTPESLVGAQSVRQLAEQLGITVATLVERASKDAPATPAAARPAATNRKGRAAAKDAPEAKTKRGKKSAKKPPKKVGKGPAEGGGSAAQAHRDAVVAVLKGSSGEMRADEIAAKAKISLNSARAALNAAHALGMAKRTGNTRTTRWSAA